MQPFFPASTLGAATIIVLTNQRVGTPPLYDQLVPMGFEPAALPNFALMAAITFESILNRIPQPGRSRKPRWSLDRLRLVYLLRLQGRSWDDIAPKLGIRHGASLQRGFSYYMDRMHLLA